MECHIPHGSSKLKVTEGRKRATHHNSQGVNEQRLFIDSNFVCPLLTVDSNGQIQTSQTCRDLMELNLKKFETEPAPVFLPSPVKCGRGPIPRNILEPKTDGSQILRTHLKLECKKILKKEKYHNLSKIKSKLKEGDVRKLGGLTRTFNRYGDVQTHSLSLAGGNLGKIELDSNHYLVHTNIKPECMLCLTRLNSDPPTYPSEVNFKSSLDGGTIYQVATPSSKKSNGNGVIFATRQLHTTILWHLKSNGNGDNQPILEKIYEKQDTSSIISCVDVNPITKGEFCELRQNDFLSISRNRELTFGKKLDKQYKYCIYASHPQNILLAGNEMVSLLDTRVNSYPSLLFSIKNEQLCTFYNISDTEIISCLAPSTKSHTYFLATGQNLLVLDHRMNNRPLLKTTHLLDQPPMYISSVCQGENMEWVFLNSQAPDVPSAAIAMSWSDQGLTGSPSCISLPVPYLEMKPQARSSLRHTLDRLHISGEGLDWSVQNRFKQSITGMVCHGNNDVIRSWICTAAGDVFVQKMDLNDVKENRVVDNSFTNWISQWTSCIREIERDSVSVVATELYSSSDVVEQLFLPRKNTNGTQADVYPKPAMQEPKCFQNFAELIEFPDERGKKFIESWFPDAEPDTFIAEPNASTAENLSQDFDLSLFTSTPYHRNRGPFLNITDDPSLLDA